MRLTDGLLALVNFCLCEVGLQYYLWPALSHFRHAEIQIPQTADIIANTIVFPALAALLTATLGRRAFSFWPFAMGPAALAALVFVFGEREFPPALHEGFWIIGVVLVGCLAAAGGAYSARYFMPRAITNDGTSQAGS